MGNARNKDMHQGVIKEMVHKCEQVSQNIKNVVKFNKEKLNKFNKKLKE
jgi:hypothetical protein